jgi:hypothetical protein
MYIVQGTDISGIYYGARVFNTQSGIKFNSNSNYFMGEERVYASIELYGDEHTLCEGKIFIDPKRKILYNKKLKNVD